MYLEQLYIFKDNYFYHLEILFLKFELVGELMG